MGNCVCKEFYNTATTNTATKSSPTLRDVVLASDAVQASMIKVVTTTGGIMELYAPIKAEQITSEFPNHGLYLDPNPTLTQPPLLHSDSLSPGKLYYLLPTFHSSTTTLTRSSNDNDNNDDDDNNNNNISSSTPYRMSVDVAPRVVYKSHPDPDVVPRYNGSGVWKVRLVINPEQLSDILSQDNKTQQLIESVRTVAKCGNGSSNNTGAPKTTSSSSVATSSGDDSDECTASSSCNFHWKSSF